MPVSPITRTIIALGVTQILGYGALYYAFGVMAGGLTADLGVSLPFAYGAFSVALLAGGLCAPFAGRAIDRHGARRVMAAGSVAAAAALAVLSQASGPVSLCAAIVLVEMVSATVLYDAAFAALAQAAGAAGARRAITLMTLIAGLASTIFWPLTHALSDAVGWRVTYLVFAALQLLVCLPLHLTLTRAPPAAPPTALHTGPTGAPQPADALLPPQKHGRAMLWLAIGFSLAGAIVLAVTVQWVPILQANGMTAAAAVTAGTLFGPAQVGVRLVDLFFGLRRHPMTMAMLAVGFLAFALLLMLILPPGLPGAMVFAAVFGLASGLSSIVRGTVPLALFGAQGYAARLGVLAGFRLASSAAAPFAVSVALVSLGAGVTLGLALGMALAALLALAQVPRR